MTSSNSTTKKPSLRSALATMRRTNGALTSSRVKTACLIEPHRGSSLTPIGCYVVSVKDHERITLAEVRR